MSPLGGGRVVERLLSWKSSNDYKGQSCRTTLRDTELTTTRQLRVILDGASAVGPMYSPSGYHHEGHCGSSELIPARSAALTLSR